MSFMDAREHGVKAKSGFVSAEMSNVQRRERLRKLALETIDLDKDPYYFRRAGGTDGAPPPRAPAARPRRARGA